MQLKGEESGEWGEESKKEKKKALGLSWWENKVLWENTKVFFSFFLPDVS